MLNHIKQAFSSYKEMSNVLFISFVAPFLCVGKISQSEDYPVSKFIFFLE